MVDKKNNNNSLLLSTDTLVWYWLDMSFMIVKDLWYDGVDLALRNNFDAWNIEYVKRLTTTYDIPVKVIQVSSNANKKELNHAVELAKELKVKYINVNAPKYYNRRATKFIEENLPLYQKAHSSIKFSIINPPKEYLLNFVPKYSFSNIAEIFKTYKLSVALDISNLDEERFDIHLIKKLPSLLPYISVIYLSDKDKTGKGHLPLWEWNLKIPSFLKKLKQLEYDGPFSVKLNIVKKDLADIEKVKLYLKKCKTYYLENYINLKLD
jgi:sugar phosphate isomerase/epimerase